MATPMYNTAWSARQRRRSGVGPSGQRSGVIARIGSWFGRDTPKYSGAGQPASGPGGSFLGCGDTPTYASAPSEVTADTAEAPSTLASTQSDPQDEPIAIVVPRSQ
jgi:hypothetical protein